MESDYDEKDDSKVAIIDTPTEGDVNELLDEKEPPIRADDST
jgi:hypothetical protein